MHRKFKYTTGRQKNQQINVMIKGLTLLAQGDSEEIDHYNFSAKHKRYASNNQKIIVSAIKAMSFRGKHCLTLLKSSVLKTFSYVSCYSHTYILHRPTSLEKIRKVSGESGVYIHVVVKNISLPSYFNLK